MALWTVLHIQKRSKRGRIYFAEGILESKERARIQRDICDQDNLDDGVECQHRIIQLYNNRMLKADEIEGH